MSRQTTLGRYGFNCIVFTDFQHTKLYPVRPFQYLSLGFILKIFLKFANFSLDILIKKSVTATKILQTVE